MQVVEHRIGMLWHQNEFVCPTTGLIDAKRELTVEEGDAAVCGSELMGAPSEYAVISSEGVVRARFLQPEASGDRAGREGKEISERVRVSDDE